VRSSTASAGCSQASLPPVSPKKRWTVVSTSASYLAGPGFESQSGV
jgi:hypothetical protein